MAKSRIPLKKRQSYHSISLRDVNVQWFENRFFSKDFFLKEESYIFIQSEQADKALQHFILTQLSILDKRNILFFFEKGEGFFSQLCHSPKVQGWKINTPLFWQKDKLFDFLCSQMQVSLPYKIREYLLESVKSETHEIINVLKTLKLARPLDRPLRVDDVQALIHPNNLDIFKLAHLYGERRFAHFYEKLLKHDCSYDDLQGLFHFLGTHLMKILDTGYTKGKKRLSEYDKKIQSQKALWKDEEVLVHLKKMAEMEMGCKKKDSALRYKLGGLYLEHAAR